jgi:hypothetical protein
MPSPKDGKAGSAVSPTDPKEAKEADKANPGEVDRIKAEEHKTQAGKYGSVKTTPYKKDPEKKSWIEVELVDEEKKPVAGEAYRITLPDGKTIAEGTLGEQGLVRIEGIDPGSCKITFPELDKEAWEKA